MKKFYLLALGLLLGAANVFAQDEDNEIDDTFQFCYKDGTIVPDGSVLNVNAYTQKTDDVTGESQYIMYTGLYVKNTMEAGTGQLTVEWSQQKDNGLVQLCFPSQCFYMQGNSGETAYGAMKAGAMQDLQSEWLPTAAGKATVTYHLKRYQYEGMSGDEFPQPVYSFLADCSTITVNFTFDPAGISNVNSGNAVKTVYYDMAGRLVREPGKGLYVKKSTMADGTVKTQKVVLK